jgi:penicillin-binding protein 2
MSRTLVIRMLVIVAGVSLAGRLFYLQLISPDYKRKAESNITRRIIEYPYRGLIYDRHDSLIVYNTPVFDLMVVPRQAKFQDTLTLANLLGISSADFKSRMIKARSFSSVQESIFYPQLTVEELAKLQGELINYPGFYVQPRTVRGYTRATMPHVLGYIGEISSNQLRRDTTKYYRSGDLVGISGAEKQYEKLLRGKRGVSYKLVDANRITKGRYMDGLYDTLPEPGTNVQLTIDLELQQYAEELMKGKVGSVVAIDPKTGEILALVSSPGYDPNLLTGGQLSKNFPALERDTLKPLFNRALQAMYPPGSMFKTVQALIGLQEGVMRADQQIYCQHDVLGDLAPPGNYDVERAIQLSSNTYFYLIFRRVVLQGEDKNIFMDSRIGLSKWRDYIKRFGLGERLGVDLPNEVSGFAPGVEYYDKVYGSRRWKFSNIYSLSIGQGEVLVSPLQMANLGAILANRGYFYTPHILKEIDGQEVRYEKRFAGIDSVFYEPVVRGMEKVVSMGSGRRGFITDIKICGKTSTVQNPGRDHSGFMGFAPLDDPKIAIAVYVENAGWGGRAAASTASLVIEKYLRGEVTRKALEDYVLKGEF